eukprot:XP_027324230.1 coiled-coil domain-containing protein 69 isoform X3 [Anas platyrhynchos]
MAPGLGSPRVGRQKAGELCFSLSAADKSTAISWLCSSQHPRTAGTGQEEGRKAAAGCPLPKGAHILHQHLVFLRQRQLKAQQGPASQELTALKTENASAGPRHGAGQEKAALRDGQGTEAAQLLQGREEEEEERLRGAPGTEAEGPRGVGTQVEKGKAVELKEQLSERFEALRREHEETLQELRRAHEQEKLLLAETHHRSQEALQETVEALRAQLKSFQERMKRVEESLLSRDYKKHIEEHGSPSPFWEQELESLHFVIEMKNEHIHGLDKKLLNLETVAERNLLLEEKLKTLQQENEDLQARTQNHLVMTRQLSEELLAARGALEKEAQLREQARREKEELLYRVLNGGDGSPFPIAAGDVPLIAT